ncbi:hypothetical protein M1710_24375, partial [Salmonella enterica subsp. enterica serovar Soahanina]|nr:hypothetical protein [Salmonella enterica subsp. enterica serovar Soahanina]
HFIIAWGFVAFVLIHVFEVLITGVFNQLRGMITGYYAIDASPRDTQPPAAEVVSSEDRPHD